MTGCRDRGSPAGRRSLADSAFPGIRQWREHDHGGNFSSMERPEGFVEDLSDFAGVGLAEEAAA